METVIVSDFGSLLEAVEFVRNVAILVAVAIWFQTGLLCAFLISYLFRP